MATIIEVNKQSVKQLLESGKEHTFVIPEYQRGYAWTNEQIEILFEDLWDFVANETQGTYFLGSIVSYHNENGEQEIIDGQQRIISLFLLLRAIYTKLDSAEVKTKEAQNFINEIEPAIWRKDIFTGVVNYADILLVSRVVTDETNQILKNILMTGEVKEKATDNYSKNYLKFIELFEEKSRDNALEIYSFIYSLLNKAILLPISADTQDTALTIFSTLNNRGLPLSDADNYIYIIYNSLGKKEKIEFIEKWKELEGFATYCNESIQQLFYYYMLYLKAVGQDKKTALIGARKYCLESNSSKLNDLS